MPIFNSIIRETTRKDLPFANGLASSETAAKVLIAGCGTGAQVLAASRYQNSEITAIDLSTSSLAYAIRKTNEYGMKNVNFKKLDLLNSSMLGELFDVIECSGVLHHLQRPADGLSELIRCLKPGGYLKLGFYSETARRLITEARNYIQKLKITSSQEGIRYFRRQVINGEINALKGLPDLTNDFYSTSECRDLCFHVKEHCFTIDTLEELLNSHGLVFCGFIVSDNVKRLYAEKYPKDLDMCCLANWKVFEEFNPLTFHGMYQFWVYRLH